MFRILSIAAIVVIVAFCVASAVGLIPPNGAMFSGLGMLCAATVVPVGTDKEPTRNKDGTPRKPKTKRTAMERYRLQQEKAKKDAENVRWSLTKEILGANPAISKAVLGVAKAKQWAREAERFANVEDRDATIARLMARIERTNARHEAAKLYAQRTNDVGGGIDAMFVSLGDEIAKAIDAGSLNDARIAEIIATIPTETIERLSAAADDVGDPFEAFRRADAADSAADAPVNPDASDVEIPDPDADSSEGSSDDSDGDDSDDGNG